MAARLYPADNVDMLRRETKDKLIPIALGLLIVGLSFGASQSESPFIKQFLLRLEGVIYDVRMGLLPIERAPSDDSIVIVAIDEQSLAEIGRFPWPRRTIAQLNNALFEDGAVVVGYDVIFSEPQINYATAVLDALGETAAAQTRDDLQALIVDFDDDEQFAASLANRDVVLGYLFHDEPNPRPGALPAPLLEQNTLPWPVTQITSLRSYTTNEHRLQSAAAGNGFMTTLPDLDGVMRRTPLLMHFDGKLYGSLSEEMARLYYLINDIEIRTGAIGDVATPESLHFGSVSVPIDASGRALIPYRGPSPSFRYISASDVLNGKLPPETFTNKLVLVGATALGLGDVVATPLQSIYPGVEIHASMLAGILAENFPMAPRWADGVNLMLLTLGGAVLAIVLPLLSPLWLVALSLAVIATLTGINAWFWSEQQLALDLALPLLQVGVLAALNISFGFVKEAGRRRALKSMFGHYVPPQLVDIMMNENEDFSIEGESRDMTVLFADVRDFTTLSETLHPNRLRALLNQFFGEMTQIIFSQRGTIDKYVGDMIMAFWGAPVADGDHAQHGLDAAAQMLTAMAPLRQRLVEQGLPPIHIGIGLNSGIMNVGDMGSRFRRAYTVIGDTVNLASRLEGLTKYYGVELVVGEATKARSRDMVFRQLDRVRVKGKSEAVAVYELICPQRELTEQTARELAHHELAYAAYLRREWEEARNMFEQLARQHPQTQVYRLYLQRIADLHQRGLDAAWDGVYERREK